MQVCALGLIPTVYDVPDDKISNNAGKFIPQYSAYFSFVKGSESYYKLRSDLPTELATKRCDHQNIANDCWFGILLYIDSQSARNIKTLINS